MTIEEVIKKIASELEDHMPCKYCPCRLECWGTDKACKEHLAEWMTEIVKEVSE